MISICGYATSRGGVPDLQMYPKLDLLKNPSHGSSQGPGDSRALRASTQKPSSNGQRRGRRQAREEQSAEKEEQNTGRV